MLLRIVILGIFVLFTGLASAQDVILLRDGSEVAGKVTEVLADGIKYRKATNPTGPLYTLPTAQVFMVTYANGEREVFAARDAAASPRPSVGSAPGATGGVGPRATAPQPSAVARATAPGAAPPPAGASTVKVVNKLFGTRYFRDGVRVSRADYQRTVAVVPAAAQLERSGHNLRVAGMITWGVGMAWTTASVIGAARAQRVIAETNRQTQALVGESYVNSGASWGAVILPTAIGLTGAILDGIGYKRLYESATSFNEGTRASFGIHVGDSGIGLAYTF